MAEASATRIRICHCPATITALASRHGHKRLGFARGDECHIIGVDHTRRGVLLDSGRGGTVALKAAKIGTPRAWARSCRAEAIGASRDASGRTRGTENWQAVAQVAGVPASKSARIERFRRGLSRED